VESFARPLMWNVPHWAEYTFYAMIPLVLAAIAVGLVWRVRKWSLGRPEPGAEKIVATAVSRLIELLSPRRLVELVGEVFFQWRLKRDPFATVMHLAIFWGMVFLFLGTALATVDQDFTNLPFDVQILQGNFYRVFELVLDVFGVVLIVGLALAAYRRYVVRPERLQPAVRPISRWDGFPFLLVLMLIALTGFLAEGLRIAEALQIENQLAAATDAQGRQEVIEQFALEEQFHLLGDQRREAQLQRIARQGVVFPAARWAPVGYGLGQVFQGLPTTTIRMLHQVNWWAHALLAFGFMVAIPFTKAFHILASPLNMFFHKPAPVGRLTVAAESGVSSVRDLTWRQLLQVDACIWCGKCQEVCPGYASGSPLSPRNVVQRVDAVLVRTAAGDQEGETLLGETVSADELWECCTCRACEDICPVRVEHPRLLIDMRRHLVDQGEVDEGLQDALMSFQRYGNSFGQSPRKRSQWTKGLEFPVKNAQKEAVEYLWFVGDYASYDQRVQEPTRAVARLLHHLGLDFGILEAKEQNAGNDVRRAGEEGLFEMLMEKNLAALAKADFQKVVTTDPHTYNTLKNEYPTNGDQDSPLAGKPILHYTELLDELLRTGRLCVERRLDRVVTYHDPCYLGRYNGVYDPPRRILRALGLRLVEMPRHGANSFCCGAGGGKVWMKDTPGTEQRPAELRIREALELPEVEYFVVACPKDLVMFQDAVKTVDAEGRLKVVDLGELVCEAAVPVTSETPTEKIEG